jgi:hypothetical protein
VWRRLEYNSPDPDTISAEPITTDWTSGRPVNGSRPPGLLPVGVVGGGVSKVTPSTVGSTDGLDVGPLPPAGHAGLLGLVVANTCALASGIVSSVGVTDALEPVARDSEGVAAIPALNTSITIARRLGISECVRVAGVSARDPSRRR